MGTGGSLLGDRLLLCMLPNILWATEVSKPVMILMKNLICSVARKDEKGDFKEMKLKKEKSEEFPKREKKSKAWYKPAMEK